MSWVAPWLGLLTLAVTVTVVGCAFNMVGPPLMAPVTASMVSPGGRAGATVKLIAPEKFTAVGASVAMAVPTISVVGAAGQVSLGAPRMNTLICAAAPSS